MSNPLVTIPIISLYGKIPYILASINLGMTIPLYGKTYKDWIRAHKKRNVYPATQLQEHCSVQQLQAIEGAPANAQLIVAELRE